MNPALKALLLTTMGLSFTIAGCASNHGTAAASTATAATAATEPARVASGIGESTAGRTAAGDWVGFDRNDYPGDTTMAAMHSTFAFTGYWLTNPPGEDANTWVGKRAILRAQGWGFLVLANGRLDKEILKAAKAGTSPAQLGFSDADAAVASAQREGFPAHTVLFLDQEEGGRLLKEQASYLLAWTGAVAHTGFRPGVYASGQPVSDGPGVMIDTIQDIRTYVAAYHLPEIAIFDAQDTCPPAPGCSLQAKPLNQAGEPGVIAWQYAQSPRRPEITKSCAATYAADGNCYAPGFPQVFLDMNVAGSADPSQGR